MARDVRPLTPDDLAGLPAPCDTCVFWEVGPAARTLYAGAIRDGQPSAKRRWLEAVTRDWGQAGLALAVDGTPAGYALYAPAELVPRATAFPTSPPSQDTVLLLTVRVRPDLTGQGLGRLLVQSMARDLQRRDVRTVEAFGDARRQRQGNGRLASHPVVAGESCVLPTGFLEAVGFVAIRDHATWPRLRLDLRGAIARRVSAGAVWERLVGVRPEPAVRPALRAHRSPP